MLKTEHVLEFELPYPSSTGNRSVRHGGGAHYLTPAAVAYRLLVALACKRWGVAGKRLAGPLVASFLVAPPDRRARDADNLLKVVQDAMTKAAVWVDDSNAVVRKTVLEWVAPEKGGRILVCLTAHSSTQCLSVTNGGLARS